MWIKICGIRDRQTADVVAKLGADAVGLNFYAKTPRQIDVGSAAEVVSRLNSTAVMDSANTSGPVEPVGLFVNHSTDEIVTICQQSGIGTVQVHGDEPPELLAEIQNRLPELNIIRAFRFGDAGLQPLQEYVTKCNELRVSIWACLVDSHVEGSYGGTGTTVAWQRLREEFSAVDLPPLILAGGLDADNVADAIKTVRPWGVDTASGVEFSPGQKNPHKVEQFINNARKAFAEIGAIESND